MSESTISTPVAAMPNLPDNTHACGARLALDDWLPRNNDELGGMLQDGELAADAPVILTTPAAWRLWLTAPAEAALALQRPLPDGMLEIVAEGVREDAA